MIQARRFPPRREWWVWASAGFMIALAVWAFITSYNSPSSRGIAVFIVLYAAWRVTRILNTWYELRGNELVVVRWPFRRRYPLENIVRVRAVNRLETPPSARNSAWGRRRTDAFALNVLVLELYQGPVKEVYISPNDRDDFLAQLRFRAPHIALDVDKKPESATPPPPSEQPQPSKE